MTEMTNLTLSNASLKEVFSRRSFKVSKIVYQKGYHEEVSCPKLRTIGIVLTRFSPKNRVIMGWTTPNGKQKTKKIEHFGPFGLVPGALFKRVRDFQILNVREQPGRKNMNFEYNITIGQNVQKGLAQAHLRF